MTPGARGQSTLSGLCGETWWKSPLDLKPPDVNFYWFLQPGLGRNVMTLCSILNLADELGLRGRVVDVSLSDAHVTVRLDDEGGLVEIAQSLGLDRHLIWEREECAGEDYSRWYHSENRPFQITVWRVIPRDGDQGGASS